ncbi:TIGR04206 family protein [Halobium salinum]|uniref:TIGR04206 family protein n=1 Tax=Halobium salinum TaxID=1364940 RepID=A0ABD5PDB4_9EURY|nr:TIGR04206 family protein [Halobium salinum]
MSPGTEAGADSDTKSGADRERRQSTRSRFALPALLLAPLFVPWTVYVVGGEVALVFPWGLVDPDPLHVTDLYSYLFVYTRGLPDYLLAWPLSALLYAAALASDAVGRLRGADTATVTALTLGFAGVAHLSVSQGLAVQPGRAAYPLGTAALWAVALVVYWTGGDE